MPDLAPVTMAELEAEQADLLPSRETLCVPKCHPCYSPCHGGLSIDINVNLSICL